MTKPELKGPSWKTWSGAIGTVAAVFVVLVLALTFQSRQEIRQQILDRDAHVLAGVASMLQANPADAEFGPDDLEIALRTSELRGVMAVRLFAPNGDFNLAIPWEVSEANLGDADRSHLSQGRPVAHFHPRVSLNEVFDLYFDPVPSEEVPLQEVLIPLHDERSGELTSIVQYLIHGDPVVQEFAALDRTLTRQAGSALALGLTGLIIIAGISFVRLRQSYLALANQSQRLLKANKELSLAARTSAVGAITSHLIHGIRNPLTGLDLFFQTRNTAELPGQSPESWQQLADATYRIRDLVDDVVEILRDQDITTSFELTLEELEAVLQEKLVPRATEAGVRFETSRTGEGTLPGHVANIVLLILINLVENAISLTPKNKRIWVEIARAENSLLFEIGDEGPGIPEEIRPHLFTPGRSGRPGGTGLGLAISHRLAANLNANLHLARSSENGTVFALECPLEEESTVSVLAEDA